MYCYMTAEVVCGYFYWAVIIKKQATLVGQPAICVSVSNSYFTTAPRTLYFTPFLMM